MSNNPFETLQKGLQDLIANSPAAELEKNMKALMAQGFNKLDLITREEFDIQVALVNELRTRVEKLEQQLADLTAHK